MVKKRENGSKYFVVAVFFLCLVGSSAVVFGDQSLLLTMPPILAQHNSAEKSWGTPEPLSGELEVGEQSIFSVEVEKDSEGNGFAVFGEWGGPITYTACTRRYEMGIGWKNADCFGGQEDTSSAPSDIAIDASGNAMMVWRQNDDPHIPDVWAKRYEVGVGWNEPEILEIEEAGWAVSPRVGMDLLGNAVVVWAQSDGTRYNIMANRYVVGVGWGTAELIEIDELGDAKFPHVAVDSTGNAVAVWEQSDGVRKNIWSNRYVVGVGWGTAELIETDNSGDAESPQLGVDAAGNAFVVWQQFDGTRKNIWANRYGAGSGWGTAELIETDNSGDAEGPQIVVNTAGDAIAVWWQIDSKYNKNIMANRYAAGEGWGAAELVENSDLDNGYYPKVGMDPSGRALVIWQQFSKSLDGEPITVSVWANRYE
ncbi:MAG: hypothetical protein D3923_07570 [Candidatus Electrothrix sp. AR3]|nr:hypothetical protein [Candidatus Electrothrix sp. AR3]